MAHSDNEMESSPYSEMGDGEVRYPLPQFVKQSARARKFAFVGYLFFALSAAWSLYQGRIPFFPLILIGTTSYTLWRVRTRGRDAVATQEGITGPHLRHPIAWREVAHLEEPLRYDPTIYVELQDGHRKSTGFPASYFDDLAALSGVPVQPKKLYP